MAKRTSDVYVAKFTSAALENIRALPKNTRNALKVEFKKLLRDPTGCSEQLGGPLAGFWSYHFLDYRVVFRVFEDLRAIAVVGVGDKSAADGAYRRLETLARTGKLADSVLATLRMFN